MFKKILLLIAVLIGVTTILSACGSADKGATNTPVKEVAVTNSQPVNFDGVWELDGGSPSFNMIAEIHGNDILISWKSDDTDALYWKGTFPAPKATNGPVTIVSKGDTEAMSSSMMASTDKTKSFAYSDGVLSYKFTIAGVTKTLHLKK